MFRTREQKTPVCFKIETFQLNPLPPTQENPSKSNLMTVLPTCNK